LEKEDFKIKLHRTDGNKTDNVQIQNYLPPGTLQPAPIHVSEQPATETPKTESTVTKDPEIKSPMIGTFYRAPSPESDDYVQVGDHVNADSVVCIVEAMKVMNEIKAEISGVITEIVAENASAVEYGQPLFRVRPA
jgi:acetyl-CoA carboxylase biotin carboxyl carrier protein